MAALVAGIVESSKSKSSEKPIAPPDRKKYENEVSKISELIKEKEQHIDLVSVGGKNYGEELTQLGTEVESFEERRGRIMAEMKAIDEKLRQLGVEISKHKAESNRLVVGLKYMTEEKYDDQIRNLNSEIQSGRYSQKDVLKLQNEISSLKQARGKVADYQKARKAVDTCRSEQDKLRKTKDSLHHQLKGIREKINVTKDKMNKCRQELERVRDKQREKKIQQDSISKEINALYARRRELSEEFRQHQLQYMEAMKNASTPKTTSNNTQHQQQQQQQQLLTTDKNKTQEEMKKKRQTKVSVSSEQGVEEERAMCRTLFTYFSRYLENKEDDPLLTVPTALSESRRTPSSHGSASPDSSPVSPSRHVKDVSSEGSYKVLPRKQETADEQWLPSTNKRRDSMRKDRKKSRKRTTAKNPQKPLQLNATIFAQFSKLGLQPPTAVSDVPNTLRDLLRKMSHLESSRLSLVGTDSEAGDSGIMSSTGISEFSEYGANDLTSGEVTPNTTSRNEMSPLPGDDHASVTTCLDSTPVDSLKGIDHMPSKTDTEGSDTPTSTSADVEIDIVKQES